MGSGLTTDTHRYGVTQILPDMGSGLTRSGVQIRGQALQQIRGHTTDTHTMRGQALNFTFESIFSNNNVNCKA